MEDTYVCSSLSILCLFLAFKYWLQTRTKHNNLPPSPPALPIVGHLHLLKQPLHRSLNELSQKYGPIISLRFGSRFVIVVSSPSAVEECFTKNDIVFANRPSSVLDKYLSYNHTTLVTAPYGGHWRNLRRISAIEIFSSNRLNLFLGTRRDEVKILLGKLYRVSSHDFAKVELKPMFSELTFNIIMRMVAGKRYYGEDVAEFEEARQFRETITEIFEYAGASYLGDYLPCLQWIDYQGFLKKVKKLSSGVDVLLQGLINEHRSENRCTMISHLLSLQESEPEYYTDEIIKGLISNLIFAGTDTSSATLEWAMSNLLNHPKVLEKAKNEMDTQIGKECLMEESDLSKLPYLHNIISETLRLYPPGPLLIPHFSSDECIVEKYNVPRNTMLLVNVWAIHRDPKCWDDATKFKPERFENGQSETCKLIPFGFGKRACPGIILANRVIGLALASMIQCFEWKRIDNEEIDMMEGNGLTMPKAEPLVVMCKAHHDMSIVLSSL